MSSITINKKPFRPGVPDEVLEQLVGVNVSCNPGPSVAYFGPYGPPPSWVKYIDQQTLGTHVREDIYYISSRTLAQNCGYEERDVAKEWLEKNLPDCWIVLSGEVCEYRP
jgi:hypothetical protein